MTSRLHTDITQYTTDLSDFGLGVVLVKLGMNSSESVDFLFNLERGILPVVFVVSGHGFQVGQRIFLKEMRDEFGFVGGHLLFALFARSWLEMLVQT